MCGINGLVRSSQTTPLDEGTLLAMRDTLIHRGPDAAGAHRGAGVALGSRRLAILDLSQRGDMPMWTPDGRFAIAYNGEVYNYRELRAGLQSQGLSFRSNTDTEVILHLFAREGAAMLPRLNGMFALAVWDTVERSLFLARDRLGVKPLYYAGDESQLYFASEPKALFAAGVPLRFDPELWEELLCFRYVSGDRTPYEGVKRLLPGHYLVWKEGRLSTHRWWNLSERVRSLRDGLPSDPIRWYRETFDDSVNLRRISDVPVGVLLSGGLDSSSVAASLALQAGVGVASFTVRFSEAGYDEGPAARSVATRFGLEYHELLITPDDVARALPRASRLNDEPLAHGNDLHILAIAKYAKPRVTVLLSGEGGDETLGGYVRYRPLRHPALLALGRHVLKSRSLLRGVRGRIRKLARFLQMGSLRSHVLYNACDVLPDDLRMLGMTPSGEFPYRDQILREAEELYPSEPVRQAMYSDHHTFLCSVLDRNDRMTMGASIECRVPFLDYRLVEGLAALPSAVLGAGRGGKPFLQSAMHDRLPAALRRRPKWGFGVPWSRYLREQTDLRALIRDLHRARPIDSGPLDRARLRRLVGDFLEGDDRQAALIRQLVFIATWYQACIRD